METCFLPGPGWIPGWPLAAVQRRIDNGASGVAGGSVIWVLHGVILLLVFRKIQRFPAGRCSFQRIIPKAAAWGVMAQNSFLRADKATFGHRGAVDAVSTGAGNFLSEQHGCHLRLIGRLYTIKLLFSSLFSQGNTPNPKQDQKNPHNHTHGPEQPVVIGQYGGWNFPWQHIGKKDHTAPGE